MSDGDTTEHHNVAALTSEEKAEWEYYLGWYRENGWGGNEAVENAWRDLQKKYPRLLQFDGPQ